MTMTSTRNLPPVPPVAPATAPPVAAPGAARNATTPRRSRRRPGPRTAIVGGGLALIVGIIIATLSAIGDRDDADTLSQQVLTACAAGGDAAAELQALGSCPLAAAVQADVQEPTLVDTGLSASQTAEVIGLVNAELAEDPPADGRTPDAPAVLAAVRQLAVQEPDLFRGDRGEPGALPSDEQLRAIAAAVIADNAEQLQGDRGDEGEMGAMGDKGEPGQPGRGIIASEEDPDDPCVRIVRYDQPPLEERWRTCPDPEPAPPQDPPPTPSTTPPPSDMNGGLFGEG